MAESIRIDPNAYEILEVHRKYLRNVNGQTGASYSDAIRHMQKIIDVYEKSEKQKQKSKPKAQATA